MEFSILLSFVTASVVLALAPGPDNIFVLTQSAVYGWTAGVLVVLGLCTGLLVHTAAVVAGVAVIFQTSELAFMLLKLAGAGYLVYLAWQAFRAPAMPMTAGTAKRAGGALYRRGIIMNMTNPKVSIFFLAFLPQFVNASRDDISLQLIMLGAIFIVCTFMVFSGIALTAGALGSFFNRSSRAQVVLNRIAALVFMGLALKLVTSGR